MAPCADERLPERSKKPEIIASRRINRALQAFSLYIQPRVEAGVRSLRPGVALSGFANSSWGVEAMNLRLASAIGSIALAAFLGIVAMSHAQAAENVRVRGTIVSVEGSTLTVKTREGPDAAVAL